MSHFRGIYNDIGPLEIIKKVINGSSFNESIAWLKTLDESWRDVFIQECLEVDKVKLAWDAIKAFNLEDRYEYVRKLRQRQTIHKLVATHLWGRAFVVADKDVDLQVGSVANN